MWCPSLRNRLVVSYVATSSLIMLDSIEIIDLAMIMPCYVSMYMFLCISHMLSSI